jgi:hypothetical protein
MRLSLCVSLTLAAALTGTGVAPVQRTSSPDALATLLLQSVHGTPVSEWKTAAPAATWQRYRGTYEPILETSEESAQHVVEPGGFWCAVATDHSGDVERVVVFFALRDTRPPACRIELMQGVAREPTEQQAAALFRDVSAAITQRLGVAAHGVVLNAADTPVPYGGGTGYPEGIDRWDEGVAWHQGDRDVFLFRAVRAVGFSSRSSLLTRDSEDGAEPTNVAAQAELRLADSLRERFPNAAAAMPFALVPEHQAEIRGALIHLLDARTTATPEDVPMLTFAADRLARKLWVDRPPAASLRRELAPLLRRGVRFVDDPYDQLSLYDGAFIRVLLRRWPETQWGQLAFVTYLYAGYTEDTCDGSAYVKVIRQGNAWLQSHPESPWRTAVMTAVARAYETQWALNGSFTADARENARVVTVAQAAARVNAIKLYGDVIRLAPTSQDAAYARRRIIQIRANMTTSQDAYSCVYA